MSGPQAAAAAASAVGEDEEEEAEGEDAAVVVVVAAEEEEEEPERRCRCKSDAGRAPRLSLPGGPRYLFPPPPGAAVRGRTAPGPPEPPAGAGPGGVPRRPPPCGGPLTAGPAAGRPLESKRRAVSPGRQTWSLFYYIYIFFSPKTAGTASPVRAPFLRRRL